MLSQTQGSERLPSFYERKKSPSRQLTVRTLEERKRKQIYKQIHNVRKWLKSENQETRAEEYEHILQTYRFQYPISL